MSNNYIVINGKKAELTEEQLKMLGIETRKNPFERVKENSCYYRVTEHSDVDDYTEQSDYTDCNLYKVVNYFNDKKFAEQVALHQLLYRKLLKFAYDNGCEDVEWNGENNHWLIFYDSYEKNFCIEVNDGFKFQGIVYFSSSNGAERAIKEIVEPFMKEHPEFVW